MWRCVLITTLCFVSKPPLYTIILIAAAWHQWGRRLERWPKTEARPRLAVEEWPSQGEICVVMDGPCGPYRLPWSGAAQLRASGKSSCCYWCSLGLNVHKTPTWALSLKKGLSAFKIQKVLYNLYNTCQQYMVTLYSYILYYLAKSVDTNSIIPSLSLKVHFPK